VAPGKAGNTVLHPGQRTVPTEQDVGALAKQLGSRQLQRLCSEPVHPALRRQAHHELAARYEGLQVMTERQFDLVELGDGRQLRGDQQLLLQPPGCRHDRPAGELERAGELRTDPGDGGAPEV